MKADQRFLVCIMQPHSGSELVMARTLKSRRFLIETPFHSKPLKIRRDGRARALLRATKVTSNSDAIEGPKLFQRF